MATILNFKPRAEGKAIPHRPDIPADIIIFPGIRYERMEGEQAGSTRRDAVRLTGPVSLQG